MVIASLSFSLSSSFSSYIGRSIRLKHVLQVQYEKQNEGRMVQRHKRRTETRMVVVMVVVSCGRARGMNSTGNEQNPEPKPCSFPKERSRAFVVYLLCPGVQTNPESNSVNGELPNVTVVSLQHTEPS